MDYLGIWIVSLSNVDRNSLPYLMAYSGIYIAFDGLTREDASPWSSTAVLSDLEKKNNK